MNILFFGSLVLYFIAMALQFAAAAFKKEGLGKAAWYFFLGGLVMHTVYLAARSSLPLHLRGVSQCCLLFCASD